MGDEGLERFSYYSIKHEVLGQSPEQVGANTGANATLSETVALLIDGWVDMCTVVPVIDVHISKADGIPN